MLDESSDSLNDPMLSGSTDSNAAAGPSQGILSRIRSSNAYTSAMGQSRF